MTNNLAKLLSFLFVVILVPEYALSQDKTPTPIQLNRNKQKENKQEQVVQEHTDASQTVIVINKKVEPCFDQFSTFTGVIIFENRIGWKLYFNKPICFQHMDEKYQFDHFYMIDFNKDITNYFLQMEHKTIRIILYDFSIEKVYYQSNKILVSIRFIILND